MNAQTHSKASTRRRYRVACIRGLALIWATIAWADALADSPDSRWQVSTPTNLTDSATSQWVYAGRLRYRLAQRHKLGIEAIVSLEDSAESKLMIGYYGTISGNLSIEFAAGAKIHSGYGYERVARMELVWQIN